LDRRTAQIKDPAGRKRASTPARSWPSPECRARRSGPRPDVSEARLSAAIDRGGRPSARPADR
jgi:hypothetical protein